MDELHVGLKGTMNAPFLRDLAAKIKRGQIGRIANGYSAGGLSYGYRVVKKLDERGEPIRGLREVSEEQAGVIRRIFHEFASGMSARMIAASLNPDGIPSPVGRASIEAYRRKVTELQDALQTGDSERREAANIVRSLVTCIEVMPREGRGELELSVHGALTELLNLPNRKTGELPRTALMVAEETAKLGSTDVQRDPFNPFTFNILS